MMRIVFALGLAVTSARVVYQKALNRTTTAEDYWKQWTEFIHRENMLFTSQGHHNERFGIFMDNIDKINRHNALGLSWEMGVTPFAHLTADEFKEQIVGGCTKPERDESKVELLKTDNVPDSVDWVKQGKVTPVKNQGQCGSCWAFSTTGSIESRYAIAEGELNELSEQELVDCAGKEGNNGCNGGLMDYGFEYVEQQGGLCSENSYKYVAKTKKLECSSKRSSCGQKEDKITSHKDVQAKSESQLEAAVAQGPVSVAIEADQETFQLYKRGVLTGKCGKKLDHGVLAVGYGVDSDSGNKYWKVKNSWGASWGMNGYILLCKDCNKNMGAGQCGIAGQPSYPVV